MTDPRIFDLPEADLAWCPGCGDFKILEALKKALADMDMAPEDVVVVSGIGQAAKTPHFMKCNFLNGLHGRALSHATGVKAANPKLTVVAVGGDGDMYGEGGNHFLHTVRRNPDIANFVYNNMVYGLTKGQASPTSPKGMVTPVQTRGVSSEPVNPLALAIVQGATFVARAFSGDVDHTAEMMKAAIEHRGYALVDIFQPCVSFNKTNTFKWFKDHTYRLEDEHDSSNRSAALSLAMETERFPLGILYREEGRPTFEDSLGIYEKDDTPLHRRSPDVDKVRETIDSMT
ncbi:pyruvate ferredoxin/flavodoxin oxidoreductase, beta subunit [Dethiosulfovibrio peptidovorans DSM 11002]|uniref:Pyruvate ferredoxin/flavodoxin oxidoreductase, beta subunit n=1 Tax=Dethiosulfovibrio peptidovorans DSM 11002 TaxID=469381 RepID=D2Z6Q9_9BACT|nr:thiamine pyrophosphate-dependent enzyme [Dethiosulfovibrio peptidovorans]EFC91156.1 pyruvate ferredoxin/flavodoxin oxidoreductase, beta subunit [Dethiosulfovibrio peptidovorans DSM 11002]